MYNYNSESNKKCQHLKQTAVCKYQQYIKLCFLNINTFNSYIINYYQILTTVTKNMY